MDMKPRYLVMVTAQNNNKYYKQIPKGDHWVAEYGRVGSAPQTATYPMSVWDKKYNEKIRKGYVDQTDLVQDLIATAPSEGSTYKEIEDAAIAQIVEKLQKMARQAIADNYTVSSNKVTQAMVDEAQIVLTSLLTKTSVSDFNETLLHLFTVIPRRMSEVSDYLAKSDEDFGRIINHEQNLLDVMKGQVVSKTVLEDPVQEKSDQTILEKLGLEFENCTDDDIEEIKKALGANAHQFSRAWKVTNKKTKERYDQFVRENNITNTKLLFHGSRNENWWSIIGSGLILKPTNAVITGKMFGYGIYFAPKAQKSIGYTSLLGSYWVRGGSDTAYMALLEVAYGKPYDVHSFDSKYYGFNYEQLQKACPGANCLHAHAGSMLKNDEIIIYKEEQCNIKYLVEIKR